VCTQPITEDGSAKTSFEEEYNDSNKDNRIDDVETIDQQPPSTPKKDNSINDVETSDHRTPSTPIAHLSTPLPVIAKVSPTSTTKLPRGKFKTGMTLRRRQQRTPSTLSPQRVAVLRGKTPASTPTTPRKSSSIGRYFSPKKGNKVRHELEDDNDRSPPSVVGEDGDGSSSVTPEKKKLRINHSLYLTDSDEYGGRFIEPSATACPRGLKRLFALLNTGERI